MPLFELYQMTKEKLDLAKQKNPSSSNELSFDPQNDFVELVWDNGQILMQGQSSRSKKSPSSNNLPSHCLPSYSPKNRDKDVANGIGINMGKFGTVDSVLNEIHMPQPSGEMSLNHDDDMVPWLNYAVDEPFQQEYCSDFMPELSGVTGNELSSQNYFVSFDKRSSSNQFNREFTTVSANRDASLENVSRVSSVGGGEANRPRSGISPLYSSSLQHHQTSFPYLRSRVSDSTANDMKNSTDNAIFQGSNPTSTGILPGLKMQKQDQRMSTYNSGVMNFSHFTRPVALVKANLQNIGLMPGAGSSRIERVRSKDKSSVASISPVESPLIDSSGCLRMETSSHCQPVAVISKVDVKPQEAKPSKLPAFEPPETICREDAFNNDKKPSQVHAESAIKGLVDSEKTIEPVVASSSVCSGNSIERASDDPPHNLKRKHRDPEDSECPSEDVDEEPVGVKKAVPARAGTGSKRSRAAEVHNLSERRRRDRINEKMRALQELIPNCNKVDKASMLDEAIEYLKTLQLQVQIMSMGAGLYMPTMMYPSGMQHMHAAHMAHFSPMGIGMGMGIGYGMGIPDMNGGSSCYPMMQMPAVHGTHFQGTSVSGPTALQGMPGSNFQLFGVPGQGHPISMPHAPLNLKSGGPIMKLGIGLNASGMVGSMDNMDAATGSISKDPVQNVNSLVMQKTGVSATVNQKSTQCEETNEVFAQPPLVQDNCHASKVTGHGTFNSSSEYESESNKAAC